MSGDASRSGEFDLIRRYFAPLAAASAAGLGLKDDASILTPPPGREIVVTTDTMVAGVHYPVDEAPGMVARKLLRVNLSDLAAMGARPEVYFLNTAWPRDLEESWIAAFAEGLGEDQRAYGIALAGGDTVATPGQAVFTLTAVGSVATGTALRRGTAEVGDDVYVSGTVGDGALGLEVALDRELPGPNAGQREALRQRYRLPEPRIDLGLALSSCGADAGVRAAADVSDGLIADLGHICAASGLGAVVTADAVPLSEAARAARACDEAVLVKALTGGDDYELVFTASPAAATCIAAISRRLGLPLSRIGRMTEGSGVVVTDASGGRMPMASSGYRHR